ncbi:MAG: protease HtpX [Gammaproteobacteria bacterium]|nr:protease HtpX [Gammaproteobacteria bacterium]
MKRIVLFLATNLAIVLLLGIMMSLFGIKSNSIGGMLFIAFAFGMGGSFISLAISKWMAKRSTGAQVIEQPSSNTERWLLETVKRQAEQAHIGVPEVAIYDSPEINAFATGMKKNDSLVAVSTGLLNNMSQDEAEAVLAHEVSHIANGDMITLALIQGIINTFVIFVARLIASAIDSVLSSDDEEGEGLGFFGYIAVVFVLELILGFFASTIVAWFSRKREYSADAGAAYLSSPQKMIAALERLKNNQPSQLDGQLAAFGIASGGGFSRFFSSHPPLEERIAALRTQL